VAPGAFKTLLDKDWLALAASPVYRMGLRLPTEVARQLNSAIQADAAFLATQGLMDYSLLLGVQLPRDREGGTPHPRNRASSAASSIASSVCSSLSSSLSAPVCASLSGASPLSSLGTSCLASSREGSSSKLPDAPSSLKAEGDADGGGAAVGSANGGAGRVPPPFAKVPSISGHRVFYSSPDLGAELASRKEDKEASAPAAALARVPDDGLAADVGREASESVICPLPASSVPSPRSPVRAASPVRRGGRWTGGASHTSLDGATYYLGVIDILEGWRLRWVVQSAVLKFFFRYVTANQWYNPEGITAIPPADYAARFEEFFAIHILGLLPADKSLGVKSWHPFW